MDKYAHPSLDALMKDPENKNCFDCGNVHPKWASINNGVYVCLNCAGAHRGLGVNLSFIRSLTMDNWDEKQLRYLRAGGNRRLKELLNEYNIPQFTEIELKYKLVALDYHRQNLRVEVVGLEEGQSFPDKPDVLHGIERIDQGEKNQRIIDNSCFISSEGPTIETKQKKASFFGKVGSFFQKTAGDIGSKIKDMNLPDKISDKLDKTANYIDKKTKDVMKSQFVTNIVNKTKNVFNPKHTESTDETVDEDFLHHSNNQNINGNSDNSNAPSFPDINEMNAEHTQNVNLTKNGQNIDNFFVSSDSDKHTDMSNNTKNNENVQYPTFNESKDINSIFEHK